MTLSQHWSLIFGEEQRLMKITCHQILSTHDEAIYTSQRQFSKSRSEGGYNGNIKVFKILKIQMAKNAFKKRIVTTLPIL